MSIFPRKSWKVGWWVLNGEITGYCRYWKFRKTISCERKVKQKWNFSRIKLCQFHRLYLAVSLRKIAFSRQLIIGGNCVLFLLLLYTWKREGLYLFLLCCWACQLVFLAILCRSISSPADLAFALHGIMSPKAILICRRLIAAHPFF